MWWNKPNGCQDGTWSWIRGIPSWDQLIRSGHHRTESSFMNVGFWSSSESQSSLILQESHKWSKRFLMNLETLQSTWNKAWAAPESVWVSLIPIFPLSFYNINIWAKVATIFWLMLTFCNISSRKNNNFQIGKKLDRVHGFSYLKHPKLLSNSKNWIFGIKNPTGGLLTIGHTL